MKLVAALILIAALAAVAWFGFAGSSAPDSFSASGLEAERLHGLQNHSESERAYARAAEEAAQAGAWREHYAYRAQRGVCLKMLGRHDEARDELRVALDWARENDELRTQGLALGNLAKVAALEGDDDLALERMDELIEVAAAGQDPRTVVLSLQQTAAVMLSRGRPHDALRRIDRARAAFDQGEEGGLLDDAEDLAASLARERAWILARLGDHEGAMAAWEAVPPSPASLARRAQHLSQLERHEQAAERALTAASAFGEDAAGRDQALELHVEELLLMGRLDEAAQRLQEWMGAASSAAALAPFRMLEGRLAWLRGDLQRALSLFEAALAARPELVQGRWLAALCLDDLKRSDEALATLAELDDSLATTLLRGWVQRNKAEVLVSDGLPLLLAPEESLDDESVRQLRRLSPRPLPTLSWLALHLHLADGDRLLERGREDLRVLYRERGLRAALQWQALEAAAELLGRWPTPELIAPSLGTISRWLDGEVAEDEAIVYVVGGPGLSYLVLFTSEWGGTSLGLAPLATLAEQAATISTELRSGTSEAIASAGARLYRTLFGKRALEDMRGKRLVSLIWPEELAGIPPALLVTSDPRPGESPRWWVLDRDLRVLPLPPASSGATSAATGVLRAGEAAVRPEISRVILPTLMANFGSSFARPMALAPRPGGGVELLRGEDITTSALRERGGLRRWELSLGGAGVGDLGGLVLAPDPAAAFGDERAGVLPWPRLASWELPPELILDRTRFDPAGGGALQAGTAAFLGGARSVLLTRWPLPDAAREAQLGEDPGALLDPAVLGAVQRAWIAAAASGGSEAARHPRAWAAWLLFGGESSAEQR